MSQGNRLHHLALRGCLIAAFALASAVALAQEPKSPNVTDEPSAEPAQQEAQPEPTPVAPAPKVDPAENQKPGRNPDYYTHEDLDAQRRMAVGAEELVTLTSNQLIITAIEVVLVLIAVGAAFWAAWEARKAAKATAETVNVTRETAQRQLRAYVHPNNPTITINKDGSVEVNIPTHNAGQTPAYQVTWYVQTIVTKRYPAPKVESDDPNPGNEPGVVLAANTIVTHPQKTIVPDIEKKREALAKNEIGFFVYGNIKYRDIFKEKHTTRFLLVYGGPWEGTQKLSTCKIGNEAD